mgnify:CR=1 FL=1
MRPPHLPAPPWQHENGNENGNGIKNLNSFSLLKFDNRLQSKIQLNEIQLE